MGMVFSGEKIGLFMVNPLEFLDFSSAIHVRSPTQKEKASLFSSASPEPHTLSHGLQSYFLRYLEVFPLSVLDHILPLLYII